MADPIDELTVVPPAEFVAARNRIVANLKAAGERDEAARIAKLKRPSRADWALNATVREQPDLAGAWAAAAAKARDASGAALRPALAELRTAAAELTKAVGDRAPAGDVTQVLTTGLSLPCIGALAASGPKLR